MATLSSEGMLHCILAAITGSIAYVCRISIFCSVFQIMYFWDFAATDFSGCPMKLNEKPERFVKDLYPCIYAYMSSQLLFLCSTNVPVLGLVSSLRPFINGLYCSVLMTSKRP